MGSKIRAVGVIGILFVSVLFSFSLIGSISAEEAESELQSVFLYLHGDPDNATLNTSLGDIKEEHHVLTTGPEDVPSIPPNRKPIFIGEWVTEPISYPMIIDGELGFVVWAKGDLQQVRFTAYLTVNAVKVSDEMSTETQNLNESMEIPFISDTVNTTEPVELNYTDIIGFSLWLEHNDPQWYSLPPFGSGGKNVTLVMGGSFPSYIGFPTNSMQVTEIEGMDDPPNMIVIATIKCSFGTEDFNYATASTDYKYGNKFTQLSETVIDDATVEVKWEWEYSVTEGGSYPVTVRAVDMNYMWWELTEDVHITTAFTEVDFSISSDEISFTENPQKDKNTTIEAKITGSGIRWSSYQVEIEFYDDSVLIDSITAKISRGKTNTASVLWVPDTAGKHDITVKIDPDNDIVETDENNNEATKNVKVKEDSGGGGGVPGFEGVFVILALCLALIIEKRFRSLRK